MKNINITDLYIQQTKDFTRVQILNNLDKLTLDQLKEINDKLQNETEMWHQNIMDLKLEEGPNRPITPEEDAIFQKNLTLIEAAMEYTKLLTYIGVRKKSKNFAEHFKTVRSSFPTKEAAQEYENYMRALKAEMEASVNRTPSAN